MTYEQAKQDWESAKKATHSYARHNGFYGSTYAALERKTMEAYERMQRAKEAEKTGSVNIAEIAPPVAVDSRDAQIASLTDMIQRLRKDPNAVHINLLEGLIAKPSIAQIIHIYGREELSAALQPKEDVG